LHEEEGYVSATHELLSIHIDMELRRSTPFPPQIETRLRAVMDEHSGFERPAGAGRVIRTKS